MFTTLIILFKMTGPPNKRRRTKAIGPDSDVFSKAKTHKTILTINRSGTVVEKDILVPLIPLKQPDIPTASTSNIPSDINNDGYMDDPMFHEMEDDLHNRTKSKVCNIKIYKVKKIEKCFRLNKITFSNLLIKFPNY